MKQNKKGIMIIELKMEHVSETIHIKDIIRVFESNRFSSKEKTKNN